LNKGQICYLVMPGHPYFGCQVQVTMRVQSQAGDKYKIQIDDQPDFIQQVNRKFLSTSPPVKSIDKSPANRFKVCISLTVHSLTRVALLCRERSRVDEASLAQNMQAQMEDRNLQGEKRGKPK
jgi:hypothetical protein